MRKNVKRIVGATLVGAFCFGLGTALTLTNNVQVEATTADFEMKTGAAVRLATESAGLRFIAEMDESKYNEVIDSATGEYKAGMSLGMVIVPTVYVEDAPEGTTDWLDYIGDKKKVVLDIPAEKVYEKDGSWCFNGVLTNIEFNSLDIDFIGIAYSYDGTDYDYADFTIANNSRNVALVASRALNDTTVTYNATNKALLQDFITNTLYREAGVFAYEDGDTVLYYDSYAAYQADTERTNGSADIQTVASSLNYTLEYIDVQDDAEFSLADGQMTLTVDSAVADADYSNIIQWSSSNENVATVENGKVTAVSGGEVTITATLFGKEYKTEVDVVTKYIENASDLTGLVTTENLKGYYALKSDITLDSFSGLTSGTFSGIFDGRGHTLSITTINPYILGATLEDATVRNLSIVDSMTRGNPSGTLTNMFKGNSKVENVYINLKQPKTVFTNAQGCLAYQNSGVLQLSNVIVYVPDKYASSTTHTGVFLSSNSGPKVTAVNSHFGSNASVPTVAIGTEEAVMGYNTLTEMQTAYANGTIDISAFKGFSSYNALRKFLTVAQKYDLGEIADMHLDSTQAYTFTVTQALEKNDISSVKIGASTISDYTFESGVFTIPVSNYTNIVCGENVTLTIESVLGHTYTAKLDVITKVLRDASDLTDLQTTKDVTAYYVLGDNITLTGSFAGITTGTFSGIFDGRGYTISGGKLVNGLLGKTAKNVIVRNLALIDTVMQGASGGQGGGLAHTINGNSIIENVFIKLNKNNDGYYTFAPISMCVDGNLTVNNLITYIADKWGNAAAFVWWTQTNSVIEATNCHVGSGVGIANIVDNKGNTAENVENYTSLTAMQEAYAANGIDISWAKTLGFYQSLVTFLTKKA